MSGKLNMKVNGKPVENKTIKFTSERVNKHRDLADSISKNLVVEGSIIKEKEPYKPYKDNLPSGITYDKVEELSKYNSEFILASHVATNEAAAQAFMDDAELKSLTTSVGYNGSKDTIDTEVHRTKTYLNHLVKTAEGEPTQSTSHLVTTTKVHISGSKNSSLKPLLLAMGEEFAKLTSS